MYVFLLNINLSCQCSSFIKENTLCVVTQNGRNLFEILDPLFYLGCSLAFRVLSNIIVLA